MKGQQYALHVPPASWNQSTTQTIKLEIHFQQSWFHNSKCDIDKSTCTSVSLWKQLNKNISPNLTVTHWIIHKLQLAGVTSHVTAGVIFTKLMTFKVQKPAANIRIRSMGQGQFLPWDLQMWVKESEVMLSVSKTNYNRNLTIWSKICIYFLKLAAFWAVAFWHNFILNMEVK